MSEQPTLEWDPDDYEGGWVAVLHGGLATLTVAPSELDGVIWRVSWDQGEFDCGKEGTVEAAKGAAIAHARGLFAAALDALLTTPTPEDGGAR